MGLIASIGNWFKSLFNKVGAFIAKCWNLASPFLKEMLSASAKNALAVLQTLAIQAVEYVAGQGLPTDEAKQKAFADYMKTALKKKGLELKDSELNLLRETALAIWKKANEQQ
jgi:hypothetical protein